MSATRILFALTGGRNGHFWIFLAMKDKEILGDIEDDLYTPKDEKPPS
jgi:hypothetical protein